jgi:hypothetical protein
VVDAAERRLRVVMEVTERAVARDRAGLLGAVARARTVGWGVALERDCGDDGPDADRRFDYVITRDRELVVRVAQPLLDKLAPAS